MAEILNPQAFAEQLKNYESPLKATLDELEQLPVDDDVSKVLSSLLALSDDQFNIIAPAYLEAIVGSFNDINYRLTFVQAANAKGLHQEELMEMADQLKDEMEKSLRGSLSAAKMSFLEQIVDAYYNCIVESEGLAKRILRVPIVLGENAQLPHYASEGAGAMDVYCTEDVTLLPGESKILPLNIKVSIPKGYALLIQPRSGLSAKSHLRIANTPGLIDSDYRGTVGVIMENNDPPIRAIEPKSDGTIDAGCITYGQSISIAKGERIAQMRLVEVPMVAWDEVDFLDETERGEGGYGSTGTK